jgi:hypothetical protein
LSVNSRIQRANKGAESIHACFLQLVKICHPGFYAFLEYSNEITLANMADVKYMNTDQRTVGSKKKKKKKKL